MKCWKPSVDLLRIGRHTLILWRKAYHWAWLPARDAYWSGELIYRSWLCFTLVTDNRKDWLGDLMGTSERTRTPIKEPADAR